LPATTAAATSAAFAGRRGRAVVCLAPWKGRSPFTGLTVGIVRVPPRRRPRCLRHQLLRNRPVIPRFHPLLQRLNQPIAKVAEVMADLLGGRPVLSLIAFRFLTEIGR